MDIKESVKERLEDKEEDVVGASEDGIAIIWRMTELMIEHSYDNKSGFYDRTATPPRVSSPIHNAKSSKASASDTWSVDCSESNEKKRGTMFDSSSL